ncbi:lipopolysaccharide biosynthesis protein [Halomonas faecis]|uniref:lipopolysaccharide biosynthesis protein n=1 Tax=Halomonas faecis TaxID=1562110 RepID=UPI00196A1507|nr:oligosaccharide flippase family protein [Halomonas faecis]
MMSRAKQRAARLLPQNKFARSVSVLAGGTAAGQIIVVAASPILTRLYSPEDFGLLAVYAGLLGILSVIASLRYQLAIPLPESDEEAGSIVVLSLLVVVGVTMFTSVIVGLFGSSIVELLNTPGMAPYLWLLPAGLFLTGVYQVFNYWAIRTKAFPAIARTKFTQALGMVGVQIGAYTLGPIALLLGRVVGQSAGIVTLAKLTTKGRLGELRKKTYGDLKLVAASYRNFPLLSTWTGLSSSAGTNLPPILIAALLGAGPAGIFALSHRVLSQPMTVLGKSVGDVFYRQAAQAHREGNLGPVVDRVYSVLVVLALPIATMIFISAPSVFVFIFGDEWAVAGDVARWMTPWLFFQFIVTPPTRIYPILGKHTMALRFQLSLLLAAVASVLLGALLFDSIVLSVAFISITKGFVYMARLVTTYKLVGLNMSSPLMALISSLPWAIACNFPLIALWVIKWEVDVSPALEVSLFTASVALVAIFMVAKIKKIVGSQELMNESHG